MQVVARRIVGEPLEVDSIGWAKALAHTRGPLLALLVGNVVAPKVERAIGIMRRAGDMLVAVVP